MLDALDIGQAQEIKRKHRDVRIGALRQIYGARFASGIDGSATLGESFSRLDRLSLLALLRQQKRDETRSNTRHD